jgi:glutathione synthase/RimK-type ligase-like ATP-grasp enzyme
MLDTANVASCPVLLQQEIPRQADVRATFIGSHVFVADIIGDDSLVDWRDPQSNVQYSKTALDPLTEKKCRDMLTELGLLYGAFDFIRTPEGELVFLELNPTGEWAWLEDRLGFPMRDAFTQLFFGERQ